MSDRNAPLEMEPEAFRELGHELVDRIADLLATLPDRPVTPGESPGEIRRLLGSAPLPEHGSDPRQLLGETTDLLFDHSLFNSHPRFLGYITASAAPIGILGELLASAVNQNVGAWILSPLATEIEAQAVRWIAELIGYSPQCGGLMVSGGNMANFVCFLAARHARATWNLRETGVGGDDHPPLRIYASNETHTWVHKATDLFGLGTNTIAWIPADANFRINPEALREQLDRDIEQGVRPFLLVGTAGTVSTGAVDPLAELAGIAREYDMWFHVDGAYGGIAATLPDLAEQFDGLALADSVAVDPHKWLYAPLEAGCALVKDPSHLLDTFSYHPPYYQFEDSADEPPRNYFEYGPENSRSFRALKVWLALQQVGREGYRQMIAEDIRLAGELYRRVADHPALEPVTHELSITTFRYVPEDLRAQPDLHRDYLNRLNDELLTRLQFGGELFLSNAVLNERYVLRACIVNFRTSETDIAAIPAIVARLGRAVDAELRPTYVTTGSD